MNYFILQPSQPTTLPTARDLPISHSLGLVLLSAIPLFIFLWKCRGSYESAASTPGLHHKPGPSDKKPPSSATPPCGPVAPPLSGSPFARSALQPSASLPPHPLYSQILAMLNWDPAIADRLLNLAQAQYPGRTELWYHEKVIEDLIRDRR